MSENFKIAGRYELKSVMLKKYDGSKQLEIKGNIVGFTISESMNRSALNGFTTMFDTENLLKEFPIVGEEIIEFTYVDWFGEERTNTFFVYAVDNIKYPTNENESTLQYDLNYVSVEKVLTDKFDIQKAYNSRSSSSGLVSDYVKEVFDEYYKRTVTERGLKAKEIKVETTEGIQDLVVPNYTPEATMHFFSRHAFSNETSSQTFRFFENRNGFMFGTFEYVVEQDGFSRGEGPDPGFGIQASSIPIFRTNYKPDMTPARQQQLMYEISDVSFADRVNTVEDINKGGYRKTSYEIDVLNGVIDRLDYDHHTQFKTQKETADLKLVHDETFVKDRLDSGHTTYFIKDYASIGGHNGPELRNPTFYTDIHMKKKTNVYHLDKNAIGIKVYGRNSLVAGSVIDIELTERKRNPADKEMDTEHSGRYLVESISNEFVDGAYFQNLTLTRYGIGDK